MRNWHVRVLAGVGAVLLVSCGSLMAQVVRPVGPAGGDVQALTALPGGTQTIYFGTPDGHIFGSTDGGANWVRLGRVGAGHDNVITAIVVDSHKGGSSRTAAGSALGQTLYASAWSLGSNGGGVFRSDNGGRDWSAIGLGGHAVRALAQAGSNSDVLIAGAVDGVFRSRDAGKSWDRISPENHEDLRNFDSIAVDPRDADTVYAGTYHLAWKTTDGGRNWAPVQKGMVTDSDVMSITIDASDPSHVFSSACSGIYHSADGGANWTKFKGIPTTSRRTVQIKQDPQHPEIVYAATTEGLWRTLDDGANWKPITPASWSILSMLIDPMNPQRLILGTERMGVEISEDGGATYHTSNQGFSHRRIADMAIDSAKPDHALVVLTNTIEPALETNDGGRTWLPLAANNVNGPLRSVFAGPDGWWGAPAKGGLVHYEGGTWVPAMQIVEKSVTVKASATKSGTAKSAPGKTVNGAQNQAKAKAAPATAQIVLTKLPVNAVVHDMAFGRGAWYAASEGGVLVSRDSGSTWVMTSGGLSAGVGSTAVGAVGVSSTDMDAWAISGRNLLTSRDAGKSWSAQPLSFEARGPVHFYAADSSNFLLASDQGLFESRDGGQSWKQNGLPELLVEGMAVAGDALVVTTRSGNLYVSRDNGRSWTRSATSVDSEDFPSVRVLNTGASESVMAASATEGLFVVDMGARQSIAVGRADSSNQLAPGSAAVPQR